MLQETLGGKSEQSQPRTGDVTTIVAVHQLTKSTRGTVVGRVMGPKDFQYISFHGKGNFAGVIRGMNFQVRKLSWIIQVVLI